jgi:hypothetical protein
MPSVGFEPTITVFQQANKVHALDRPTPVTGGCLFPYYFPKEQ